MKLIYQISVLICLVGLGTELQAAKYRVSQSYPHGGPFIGKKTIIQFSLYRGTETTPLEAKELQLSHEKLIHMMTIDSGFQEYHHEHPEEVSPGVWELPILLTTPGSYRFYLQFLPEDEITTKTVAFDDLYVADPNQVVPTTPVKPQEQLVFIDGAYKVTLNYLTGQPVKKKIGQIYFTIEKNGVVVPFSNLDLYLGGKMHIAGISADKADFLHAHPGENFWRSGPDVEEITKIYFQQAGYYGLFMQYNYDGVVRTAQFALQVKASP